jgi:UDP-N-acetyl-D-mannosaminuronate dehydrogenase
MVPKMGSDYVAVVLAVGHREYREMGKEELEKISNGEVLLFDIKGTLRTKKLDYYWQL